MRSIRKFGRSVALAVIAASFAACSSEPSSATGDDSITSRSAQARKLTFEGYVYVAPDATNDVILAEVRKQTQSAFGPLRILEVSPNSRELAAVDPTTFVKTPVKVIDTATPSAPAVAKVRVRYTYTDDAAVTKKLAERSAISLAVLGQNYAARTQSVLSQCTNNDAHAREFALSLWYVFDPSRPQCGEAMAAEQKLIDLDREKLLDPVAEVSKSEAERLYIPVTVSLGPDSSSKGETYPEYDKLFSGGVKPGALVIGMVFGKMDSHFGPETDPTKDLGFREWALGLRAILKARPSFKVSKIEPQEDVTAFTINGKSYAPAGFDTLLDWVSDDRSLEAIPEADRAPLRATAGKRLAGHWVTLSAPVTVTVAGGAPKPFTIDVVSFPGAEKDSAIHKRALKTSDVFVYVGHSYIGYGPLDATKLVATDLPPSYQLLFMNGCVSYNYYEKDYFSLKGGPKNLDMVTNGLETMAMGSGSEAGRFVSALISGTQPSYRELLAATAYYDALRVVDGEIGNAYSPALTPIVLSP